MDIIEQKLKDLQDWASDLNFNDDIEAVRTEILQIHDKDTKEMEEDFDKKLEELAKEAKELAKKFDLNKVWTAPHFLKVLERLAAVEKRPIPGGSSAAGGGAATGGADSGPPGQAQAILVPQMQ